MKVYQSCRWQRRPFDRLRANVHLSEPVCERGLPFDRLRANVHLCELLCEGIALRQAQGERAFV